MLGRALTFPIAAILVPAVWWFRFRDRPYPVDVDLLFTAPFLIDVVGNALGLYDSIEWWDDANHFFNWMLITAAAALVLRSTGSSRLICFGLAVGFAAVTAIAWELAEYITFVRDSPELATAYTDTLGDLTLGTLGGTLGATIVGLAVARPPSFADVVGPAVARFVAEQPPGVVDGEERLAALDRATKRDGREDLGHQVRARPGHDRVGRGDDATSAPSTGPSRASRAASRRRGHRRSPTGSTCGWSRRPATTGIAA